MAVHQKPLANSAQHKELNGQLPGLDIRHVEYVDIRRRKYFFGAQGRGLIRHISIAGALGFFLFGYDQGVLGV